MYIIPEFYSYESRKMILHIDSFNLVYESIFYQNTDQSIPMLIINLFIIDLVVSSSVCSSVR